ncbi:MAG: glycerate kinase [Burkholderiales bacterium]|nr:glycerate kinase [Burkholderiales bacterium]
MNFQKIFIPVAGVATVLVMWMLLHFTRMMNVLKRAASRPIGHVDSAVMLNARLQPGMTLLHVIAMTRALGKLQSEKDAQPEVFRWTDATHSHVTCTFAGGKLAHHALFRPADSTPE